MIWRMTSNVNTNYVKTQVFQLVLFICCFHTLDDLVQSNLESSFAFLLRQCCTFTIRCWPEFVFSGAQILSANRICLTFMGPCIANVFSSITNKMQRYTIYLFLWNAIHVSGGSSTHHQELINCIYRILSNLYCYLPLSWQVAVKFWQSVCIYTIGYSVKPLLLSATDVADSSKGLTRCCIYRV